MTVKCAECNGPMNVVRENVKYDHMMGLPVTLANVQVRRCPQCGEFEVVIPKLEELLGALAGAIIRKPRRLTAAEACFLRKYLGWSGADFARRMGTHPETVSRWEHGNSAIDPRADRLLRLMVSTVRPVEEYSLDLLQDIEKRSSSRPERWHFGLKGEHWERFAA